MSSNLSQSLCKPLQAQFCNHIPYLLQMADAMEMMILAILGPVSRCEWHLEPWNEALLSTVRILC